jgi:hypothetical protein
MNKESKLYFDTRLYGGGRGGNIEDDLATVLLENGEAPLEDRITPYEINFNKDGKPNFKMREETENDFYENTALLKAGDLMRKGSKYLLWISPPSEEIGYKESRMVVFINKGEKDRVLISECRGICAKFGIEECLNVARKLGNDFKNGNELRSNPIEFSLEENSDWIERLEEVIEMPKVWEAIREGNDWLNKKKKREMVEEIIDDFKPRINREVSYQEALLIGSQIEKAMERRGSKLQSSGSCGISNSEALKLQSSFDVVFNNSLVPGVKPEGYNYFCKPCNCYCKENVCPFCKLKLKY